METRYTQDEQKEIALTILSQFAGGRKPGAFTMMTGAKNIVALDGGVQFSLPGGGGFCRDGINRVTVILTPADEYDVTFSRVRAGKEIIVKKHEGAYCDDLSRLFEEATGLLPYMGY